MKDWLLQALQYDAWANARWLSALDRFRDPAHAKSILEHVIRSEWAWLERCGMVMPQMVLTLEQSIVQAPAAWAEFLSMVDLERPITYTNTRNETYTQPVREILLHVINHGTYHRGHLRGLADAEGLLDFDDTDLIGFLRMPQ